MWLCVSEMTEHIRLVVVVMVFFIISPLLWWCQSAVVARAGDAKRCGGR